MEKIKVCICDDAEFICTGVMDELKSEPDIEFSGYALNVSDCMKIIRTKKPHVLLLDIQLDNTQTGIDSIPAILGLKPDIKIVMFTSFDDDEYLFSAFANGADDYCLKRNDSISLAETIRKVYYNESELRADLSKKLAKKTREVEERNKSLLGVFNIMSKLTTTEFELLKALNNGESYKDIAKRRFVEVNSIRQIASRAIRKFGADSMNELLEMLKELKIFEIL